VPRELGHQHFLVAQRRAQIGAGFGGGAAAGERRGFFQARHQDAHARQLRTQVGPDAGATSMGAQQIGIPFSVELFEFAQVEQDVAAHFGVDHLGARVQEHQQRAHQYDGQARQ